MPWFLHDGRDILLEHTPHHQPAAQSFHTNLEEEIEFVSQVKRINRFHNSHLQEAGDLKGTPWFSIVFASIVVNIRGEKVCILPGRKSAFSPVRNIGMLYNRAVEKMKLPKSVIGFF